MPHTFYKYQGTGNDFVLIDNRKQLFPKNNTKLVAHLCDRRFGVGADGLILLEHSDTVDFKMVYYNADGNESTMCGNGGRCLVSFAHYLSVFKTETTFEAVDGLHFAKIEGDIVSLQMIDVSVVEKFEEYTFLDTGSPHHVELVSDIKHLDVKAKGSAIRYSDLYKDKGGSNINFVEQISDDSFVMRTYERGVEDETLSCGTGATAVAIAMFDKGLTKSNTINLKVEGGFLTVSFKNTNDNFEDVFLKGPAKQVFKGEMIW